MDKIKVLIAIDEPELAKNIVHSASNIFDKNKSEITLINVLETTVAEEQFFYTDPQKFIEHEAGKADFAYIESFLDSNSFDYKGFIYKEGNAADNILATAREGGFDLIVVGSNNKHTMQRFFLGSVSFRISRESKASVLVIKPSLAPSIEADKDYSVLFAVDSSEYSEYASSNIGKFIDRKRAEISLLHVTPPIQEIIPTDAYIYTDISRIIEESELVAKEILKNYALNVAKQNLTVSKKYYVNGDPATTIINESLKKKFNIIVMGSHGKSSLTDWFMGGVSSRVYEYSTLPVLIIKK